MPPGLPSNNFTYFFREALRRIWVSKRTSFLAISMIAISLFILGACLLVAENLERAVTRWQGKSRANVYFDSDAKPEQIRFTDSLPKTRSGKIMRRLLREIATSGSVAGDVTTLEDFSVLEKLRSEEE